MSWLTRLQWSNSQRSWQERGAVFGVIVAAAAIFWFGASLPPILQIILWSLLGLISAVLLRRGWLKLFGPVLFYELVRIARRSRFVWIRFGYACLLFLFLSLVYSNSQLSYAYERSTPREQAARMAENYFHTFMWVQMIAVSLLTPAYVAGAIAEDKEKRILEFLFATDLRNREIVLSKLGARLANIFLFLLAGLPILSFVQFLGGVDPNLVLAGFAATGMTMLGLAGVSILFSAICRRPRDAIAMTYLTVLAYVGLSFLGLAWGPSLSVPIWFGDSAPTLFDVVRAFSAGNLLYVLFQVGASSAPGSVVPGLLRDYAIFHGSVALVCTVWATLRLRAIALSQQSQTRRRFASWLASWRPGIADSAMHWKEVFVEGGARVGWLGFLIVAIVILVTMFPGYYTLFRYMTEGSHNRFNSLASELNIWVRIAGTVVACILLLGVAVRASTSITGERERQTFDTLLTTPLESETMLHAKWLGSLLTVRLGWIWLALIWLPALLVGGLQIMALLLLLVAWFVYAGVCAAIGLWFSMVCRTSLQATVATIAVLIAASLSHWLIWFACGPLFFLTGGRGGSGNIALFFLKMQTGITPPFALGVLAFKYDEPQHQEMAELIGCCLVGLVLWTVVGLIIWYGAAAPYFKKLTRRENVFAPMLDEVVVVE